MQDLPERIAQTPLTLLLTQACQTVNLQRIVDLAERLGMTSGLTDQHQTLPQPQKHQPLPATTATAAQHLQYVTR